MAIEIVDLPIHSMVRNSIVMLNYQRVNPQSPASHDPHLQLLPQHSPLWWGDGLTAGNGHWCSPTRSRFSEKILKNNVYWRIRFHSAWFTSIKSVQKAPSTNPHKALDILKKASVNHHQDLWPSHHLPASRAVAASRSCSRRRALSWEVMITAGIFGPNPWRTQKLWWFWGESPPKNRKKNQTTL